MLAHAVYETFQKKKHQACRSNTRSKWNTQRKLFDKCLKRPTRLPHLLSRFPSLPPPGREEPDRTGHEEELIRPWRDYSRIEGCQHQPVGPCILLEQSLRPGRLILRPPQTPRAYKGIQVL